jgi:NAD(P)-dependent dehydrogenase (short-subunit alcohol dehydrogenase family)
LVTGASTGIGRSIVEHLSSGGHPVVAGARKDSDLRALRSLRNVTPVRLDVTKSADIARVAAMIRASAQGLYGLVNNAGNGMMGPLPDSSVEDLHRALAVNLDGMHRMVSGMFPFLQKSRGRIVNISSINGFITEPLFGGYCISKFAVEAYTDTLRAEVQALESIRIPSTLTLSSGTDGR